MQLLLVALFVFAVLWPSLRFAAFLVSNWRAGRLGFIRSQLGGFSWPFIQSLGTAMAAEVTAVVTYPATLFMRDRPGKGTPVILVHGLYHSPAAWVAFLRRLRRAGHESLYTYGYDSFTKDFDVAVAGLERKIDAVLSAHPGEKVALVGHSLGGLVSRKASGAPRFSDRIHSLTALGSPHKGADLARFAANTMARQLIPGRHIAQSVEAGPDPNCPKLAVYTLFDDYVFPLEMLKPGGRGWTERICPPMSHVWMLYSGRVADMVLEFLSEGGARPDR